MRVLSWAARIILFLFLFAFAIKNTDPVGVRFFLNNVWHAPLVIVLLGFFAGGVALAVLSLLGTLVALRREVAGLRRTVSELRAGALEHPERPA